MKGLSHFLALFGGLFSVAFVVLQTSPALAATKVSASQQPIHYIICGDQGSEQGGGWTQVTNGVISSSEYSGPLNGYTGPAGYSTGAIGVQPQTGSGSSNAGNCSGNYYWSWNQPSQSATWTWQNVSLFQPRCIVSVYIPSWYAGAHDAHYTLSLTTENAAQTISFDPLNQEPYSAQWVDLTNQGKSVINFPDPNGHTYTFSLMLRGGNSSGLYLAASAVRFTCISTSTTPGSGPGSASHP